MENRTLAGSTRPKDRTCIQTGVNRFRPGAAAYPSPCCCRAAAPSSPFSAAFASSFRALLCRFVCASHCRQPALVFLAVVLSTGIQVSIGYDLAATFESQMASLSVLPVKYSGFFHQVRETPYLRSKFLGRVDCGRDVPLPPTNIFRTKTKPRFADPVDTKFVTHAASNDQHLRFDDDLVQEPFLITLIKETLWGLQSLFVFLVEQPSQLKYIEWPGFSNTLRTATLTLVLVALLIVALSTVDSVLGYVLVLLLRKIP
ncbi:hypothetical protein PIB30_030665 [Stylosanthes scabra]|uniref:Uncharacterized protein n=1 Tax=Stylosanthes scabra TaxID=79078 RepID=A0ABU6QBY4_9FABA|nr:hypothetical protein [Stylosanthes scabra]